MRVSTDNKKNLDNIEVCTNTDFLLEEEVEPDNDFLSQEVYDALREYDYITEKMKSAKLDKENRDLQEELSYLEIERGNLETEKKPTSVEKSKPVKKGKGISRGLVTAGVVMVLASGAIVYNQVNANRVETYESKVDRMYTSDRKEDIKDTVSEDDVEDCLTALEGVKTNNTRAKEDLERELETIKGYISDMESIDEMSSSDYDLNSADMQSRLAVLKVSASEYIITGLSLTALDKVQCIEDEYVYYESLKAELSTIEDYINFDYEGYSSKVSKITHTVNREELTQMVTNLNFEKLKAEGIENAKEVAEQEAKEMAEKFQVVAEEKVETMSEKISGLIEELSTFIVNLTDKN